MVKHYQCGTCVLVKKGFLLFFLFLFFIVVKGQLSNSIIGGEELCLDIPTNLPKIAYKAKECKVVYTISDCNGRLKKYHKTKNK